MALSVLIVEDNCGHILKNWLDSKEYSVTLCRDGREAVEAIQNGLEYQIALIDLSLPKEVMKPDICFYDGADVIRISKEKNPDVPVICSSGYDYKPDGAEMLLQKPFTCEQMIKAIEYPLTKQHSGKL